MNKLKLENLENLIQKSKKIVNKYFKTWNLQLDSANFQTKSKEDFEKFNKIFKQNGFVFVNSLQHAGRIINVYKSPENVRINYVELSEPKPNKPISQNQWEYASFIVSNYDQFIENSEIKTKLEKIRIIANDKFCYFKNKEILIQFRNKSIAESQNFIEEKPQEPDLMKEIQNLKAQLTEEKEKRINLMADFENYRKITKRELENNISLAEKNIVIEILEILDALEHGLKNEQTEGLKVIYDKLNNLLQKYGYKKLDIKKGDNLDPNTMEVVTTLKNEDKSKKNTIADIIMSGYIHEPTQKVIRIAKVVVWE